MVDPITALGLASNILQVIEFGSKFVSTAWAIRKSGIGARAGLANFTEAEKIRTDLEVVLEKLRPNGEATDADRASEQSIERLASECATVAEQLLQKLREIFPEDIYRKREIVKATFKSIWQEEDIKSLRTSLADFRNQLVLHLLVSLR